MIFDLSNSDGKFLRFSNADGKTWIMPKKNMRTALGIYQFSSLKGQLLRWFLPYVYALPFVRKVINAGDLEVIITPALKQRISEILGVEDFEFSIFEGTPSVHKKMVVQIWKDDKILAYLKMSNKAEIVSLFDKEKRILDILHSKGVNNIPSCLYSEKICEGRDTNIFIETTTKTNASEVVHKFTDKHFQFLDQLYTHTKQKMNFEDSDFARTLHTLEDYESCLSLRTSVLVNRAIRLVRDYYSASEVEFSAYHGDFTPWNTYVEKGELFVFDFEYAAMSYPPYMDWFHFFVQIARYEKHLTGTEIIKEFEHRDRLIDSRCDNVSMTFVAYLLRMISLVAQRDQGVLSKNAIKGIRLWVDILEYLLEDMLIEEI